MKEIKRVVVKFGTQNLMKNSWLNQDIFNDIARQIAELLIKDIEVVIVSSGAIQAGRERLKFLSMKLDNDDLEKKDIAGIGMRYLLSKWGMAFHRYNHEIAQVLVTHANWREKGEKESIKKAILNYMKCGFIPIINENDVVSNTEIGLMDKKISENDQLAGMVVELIGADAVLFLTDVGGIYNDDPTKNQNAKLYRVINVDNLPPELKITHNPSKNGRGGMIAKLNEGIKCFNKGAYTAISGLTEEDVILKFVHKELVGTTLVKN